MSKSAKQKSKTPAPAPESFNLPRTGVESHAHLNGPRYLEDLEATLERAKRTGLAHIGQVFMSSEAWKANKERFAGHPEVFFLLAVHPNDAQILTDQEFENIRRAISEDKRIKAVGETGLDYFREHCPQDVQKAAFVRQLHLAREAGLPVVIHCRDATEDTISILDAEGFKDYPLLWHCFGEGREEARQILDRGWHISIPGTVTFPSNHALRDAVAYIPEDRIMMETDCPYLAPMPHRGERNEPAYLAFTIQVMAEAKGMSPAELWTRCGENAIRFFRL